MTLNKKNFFIFFVIFEILYFKNFLFRPYNTPGQESLISFFAHQAAMSNWVRLDLNIFVTKNINCDGSLVFLMKFLIGQTVFFIYFHFYNKVLWKP